MTPRHLLTAFLVVAPLAAQTPAPSPSPRLSPPPVTFAAEVAYVEVDAIVTDRAGRPVRDLRQEEFVVLEDGTPQRVDLFAQIDIPYERPEPLAPFPVPADVRTNESAFEGRLYVIVLDGLHTSPTRTPLVRAAARQFLERHFAEGDLAAVVHTAGGAAAGQELTGDRRLLLAAVDRFHGRRLPSATLSRIEEYQRTRDIRQAGDPVRDPEDMQRGYDARATLDTLASVADWLGRIRGRRKAVLVLSEGIDYDVTDVIGNREASSVLEGVRSATAAAVRGNVSFYTVDPRGLGGLGAEMMEIQPVFDDPRLGLDPQGLDRDLRRSQDSLRVLADETSGLAAVNTNDLAGVFTRVVKDNSAYYVLGYYPPGQKRDGRFHRLEVRVTRPGLQVRARSGYSAPRGRAAPATMAESDTPPALVGLLDSPLPRPGLSMAVQAAAFEGQSGKARVLLAVQYDGRGFRFTEKDGISHEALELSAVVVTAAGKATGMNHKVQLDLRPRTRQMVEAAGFRVLSWLDLAPGRYQIRVASRALNAETSGSVFYDLEVPEFGKPPLTMSGLVVTSAAAGAIPTTGSLERLEDVLPAPPTTWRAFSTLDTIALMAELYDAEKRPHTLEIATTLTAPDGSVAFRSVDERSPQAAPRGSERPTIVHTARIPLKEIPPGTYTLRVRATSRLGRNPPSAEQALPVEVVPARAAPAASAAPQP
ncbi:MAG TPA: VWA domain-containing protein [Vicinamibacteria bacterium]|nr:VWA domain-containing protein [Vicinamibacteria bacterium]